MAAKLGMANSHSIFNFDIVIGKVGPICCINLVNVGKFCATDNTLNEVVMMLLYRLT